MKLKSKIAEIAGERGFKNAYALQNALQCSPTMAARLWSGEFKQIGIETLEKLGELLECSPNDLLGYDGASVKDKPKQRPLNGFEAVKAATKKAAKSDVSEVKEITADEMFEGMKERVISGKFFKNSVLDIVQSSSDNELLSTHQVAERLGVSRKSVNDYIVQGKLPAVKGKQGHNFISIDDVLIFEAVYKGKS